MGYVGEGFEGTTERIEVFLLVELLGVVEIGKDGSGPQGISK